MENIINTYHIHVDYYVYESKKYYYIETTNTEQFHLSEIPPELKKLNYKIHPVADKKEDYDIDKVVNSSNLQKKSNWKEYIYLNNKFKIELPSEPTHEVKYYGSAKYDYYTSSADNMFYQIMALQSNSESIEFMTLEEAGKIALLENPPNSIIVSNKKIELNGLMAYETLIRDGNIYTKSIKTASSGYAYTLSVLYDIRNFKEENSNKFFDSFYAGTDL